jgi:hypothetical protein
MLYYSSGNNNNIDICSKLPLRETIDFVSRWKGFSAHLRWLELPNERKDLQ